MFNTYKVNSKIISFAYDGLDFTIIHDVDKGTVSMQIVFKGFTSSDSVSFSFSTAEEFKTFFDNVKNILD